MTQPRSSRPFLQTALNEDRMRPAAPHTPAQIGAEALAAVPAGAQSVHRSMPTRTRQWRM
jgi:uncharacterized protein (DUF849 family)